MAGLGPAIHAFSTARSAQQVVDPRAKPGDDGPMAAPAGISSRPVRSASQPPASARSSSTMKSRTTGTASRSFASSSWNTMFEPCRKPSSTAAR
ncbi:MAG: hypothetical protein K0S00_2254 [Xanthobacteraceae bacterium]|nr:hypothetical protein [Xanthobacteraceae bacterium]